MESENYYILLELPFDPPAGDAGQIRAAIGRKKQEWTRWQDNPSKRAQALAYLAALPDIEQTMLNPAGRGKQAREAQTLAAAMLRRFEAELRILEGKGYLLPREAAAIAAKYRAYGADQQRVSSAVKVPISEQPPPPKPGEDGETDAIDRLTAKTVRRGLNILGKQDLYAFLGEPQYSSIKKLCAAAEQQRRRAATGGKSAKSAAAQELSGVCLRLFESFDTKQRYDRYLKISAYPELGEVIDDEFTRSRHISPAALLGLVNFAVEACGCKVLEAEEHIRRYCAAYRIPIGDIKPLISCPSCKEQTARDGVVCTVCAAPLRGDCPSCGAAFEEGPAACGACGFLLGDMAKALPYIEKAHGAVADGCWSSARRSLEYVEKYWPGHPETEPLKKRARAIEQRYAWYVEQINDCISRCQYYAAASLAEEAGEKGVRLPGALARQIEKVTKDFERRLEILGSQPEPDMDSLLELSVTVADSIELSRMLSRNPPAAPAFLEAAVSGRQVRLRWGVSDSPGKLDYLLVRGRGEVPLTAFDGDLLYEGPANSYTDDSAEALTDYYYRVFSRRGGACCKEGALFGPAAVIPEIERLRILPADQGAQLDWAFNPDIREVIIWRKLGGEKPSAPGDGVLLETGRTDGFIDTKIKNDVEYWYYISAVYMANGRRMQSGGVCGMVTPHKIPAPVRRLDIVKSEYGENEFAVSWQGGEGSDLILLSSPAMPDFKAGEIFPVRELLDSYRNLSLHVRAAGSGVFRYSFTGCAYVFAAAVFGKFAAVGTPQCITNIQEVDRIAAGFIGDELYMNMRWPAGLAEIALTWRADGFPESMNELGAEVMRVTREQYDYNAGIILRNVPPGVCFFKIYSLCKGTDGRSIVSGGVEFVFKNLPRQEVFYRISYKKQAFKAQARLNLTLSGMQEFSLPKAALIAQTGRLPLSRADGRPLLELEQASKVDGEVIFQYQIYELPANTYLRLFLLEDEQYRRFRLSPISELAVN